MERIRLIEKAISKGGVLNGYKKTEGNVWYDAS